MSKITKLRDKLYKTPPPTDFTWENLKTLLTSLGFNEVQGNGSRVKFIHDVLDFPIIIHKPHPQNTLKQYSIKQIKEALDELKTLLGE
ncbi:TPA: type II toxin-antitoxin system HicA family toxin [Pasteurella multocida]|uniref:Type II toxin-antitoxin system HicA family toxin n=1 Tax=Pasteurella multocida TaxID=747 RepID=A0AAW8VAX4_PASMD|nr:type II toxin-antitoxin system HicA family toxin [Pasteurella multocida]AON58469.1 hexulose-6-phosphate synthase [Pasteurella multocida]AON59309.1 hexulose-6-phosphate synthase [Pasteurella multocida]AUK27469.1 hexulose-6-phosphate synthase [Pasteurella multocida]AUK28665.1 hexulose-6-phosphate synthase [Pasteurella multocida]AUK33846.1 hexulose-6-phosphate synthase [Pasteurella multocida]